MNALFYPFHLCHEQTLHILLVDFEHIHFRDFMALQLTPLMGTTAFPDRMGDYYPDFLKTGRLIQGHFVSGRMSEETISAVNRDLADPHWRSTFHEALQSNLRFQKGLFDHDRDKEILENISRTEEALIFYDVAKIQNSSGKRLTADQELAFEYGFALIKTSVSLVYTVHLCQQLQLVAVTDSEAHFQLLTRTIDREHIHLNNTLVRRENY